MSTEGNVCPFCKGTGTIPKKLLSKRSINFLGDLLETQEMESFLNWAELKWRSEPDKNITQAVHRELEIAMKSVKEDFQNVLKAQDEEHQKWLQSFIENADLKEDAKKQLMNEIINQWEKHAEECRNSHTQSEKRLTEILEKIELTSRIPAKGYKFEDRAVEQLEAEFPHWEFEQTDSKIGDCIAKPKVKNGSGEYEPTNLPILLEFSTEQRIGTQKIRQLVNSMKRRNLFFGAVIVERIDQIAMKYQPFWIEEGKIAIVPFEFGLHRTALITFEAIITTMHNNGKKTEEVNWEEIKSVVNEIVSEEQELIKDITKIGDSLVSHSGGIKTKLVNRLLDHQRKTTERLKEEILKGGSQ